LYLLLQPSILSRFKYFITNTSFTCLVAPEGRFWNGKAEADQCQERNLTPLCLWWQYSCTLLRSLFWVWTNLIFTLSVSCYYYCRETGYSRPLP
jgi:hypothetical protein